MSLDIGYGMVKENGDAYYRPADPEAEWECYEDWTWLLGHIRNMHGTVNVTISEGFMNERFRYTIYEMPWEPAERNGHV